MFRKDGDGKNSGSRGLPARLAGWSPGFYQWSHVAKSLRKTTRHCKERITMAKNRFTVHIPRLVPNLIWLTLTALTITPTLANFHHQTAEVKAVPPDMACVPTGRLKVDGTYSSPLSLGSAVLESKWGFKYGYLTGASKGPTLRWDTELVVAIPKSNWVRLSVFPDGKPVTVTVQDDAGKEVASSTVSNLGDLATLILTDNEAVRLVFRPGGYLGSLCYGNLPNSAAKGPDSQTQLPSQVPGLPGEVRLPVVEKPQVPVLPVLPPGLANPVVDPLRSVDNWGFELGNLRDWTPDERTSFSDQPTQGDPTWAEARRAGVPAPVPLGGDYWMGAFPNGHQGDYWFTTYNQRSAPGQGDIYQGSLTSKVFTIRHRYISFLVSGGNDSSQLRVELWVKLPPGREIPESPKGIGRRDKGFTLVQYATGNNSLVMNRQIWDVGSYAGLEARIRIVDESARAPFGHISVDDFRFTDQPPRVITVTEGGVAVFRDPDAPVWGFADLHAHPMAHLGFGGRFFSGEPDGPMDRALSGAADAERHGVGGTGLFGGVGNVLFAVVDGDFGHRTDGWPTFDGWPSFRTRTHQQMYVEWIRRAYEGGQRILVALAVNNMLLAKEFGGGPDVTRYNDNTVVDRQIQAIKEMVANHSDWMEIAYSPADARRIIHSNKLAVVLGVEVDALGNCIHESDCNEAQVDAYLQHLYNQGVRQITPVHLTDNAFGSAAIYSDLFSVLNRFLRGEIGRRENMYFEIACGSATGVQFRLGELEGPAVGWYRAHVPLAGRPYYDPPNYANMCRGEGHVNRNGITRLGRYLLNRMMDRGMLIDIDHMSEKMTNEVLDIFEQRGYPPVSSHTGFRHLAWLRGETTITDKHNKLPNESQKTRQQLERIRDLGGIIAPISNQLDLKDGRPGGPVPNDCPGSSKTWAQAYLNAVDIMRGRGVAIGTDFNGLAGQPGPRFGTFACPGIADDEIRLQIRSGYNQRRMYAERQRNGVRYQTPISDFRNYRFKEMGGPELYTMEEREIWEAIALYKSGTDPARANIALINTLGDIRTPWQVNKVRNLAKGFRAARYEQLDDPGGGATFIEQLAAFMAKVGQTNWTSDRRIRERFDRDADLRNLYHKVLRIWGMWHQMEGNNAPLSRSTAGRIEVAPGEFRPRDFDINLDGLAHYGMLPDFIQDLKNSGMGEADLQPLFRSAEEYIRVWERAEDRAHANQPAPSVQPALPGFLPPLPPVVPGGKDR